MEAALLRYCLRYFERPRNRFITYLGLGLVIILEGIISRDATRLRKRCEDREVMAGRAGLLKKMLEERINLR